MKIVGTIQAKNESDIIESICRYSCTFCDQIIVQDNGSSDRTMEILTALIQEGLPISLRDAPSLLKRARSADINIHDAMSLCRFADQEVFEKHEADLLIPIDCDEFLYSSDGKNPREELERLGQQVHYIIPRRFYIYEDDPDDSSTFLPEFFTKYANYDFPIRGKIVMSRHFFDHGFTRGEGNHTLVYPEGNEPQVVQSKLEYAHYPLRSVSQAMLKIILSWMQMRNEERPLDFGQHMRRMYESIQQHGCLTKQQVTQMSKVYTVVSSFESEYEKDIPTVYAPLNYKYCEKQMGLKYTDYSEQNVSSGRYYKVLTAGLEGLFDIQRSRLLRVSVGSTKKDCLIRSGIGNDMWCGPSAELAIRSKGRGVVHIVGYYPFEIKGDEKGCVWVDGTPYTTFSVKNDFFSIDVDVESHQVVTIKIICDFSVVPDGADTRRLSFVLHDIFAE